MWFSSVLPHSTLWFDYLDDLLIGRAYACGMVIMYKSRNLQMSLYLVGRSVKNYV